jgi:hypothetical protein
MQYFMDSIHLYNNLIALIVLNILFFSTWKAIIDPNSEIKVLPNIPRLRFTQYGFTQKLNVSIIDIQSERKVTIPVIAIDHL